MYYQKQKNYKVDFLYTNKLITKDSFVLLPDNSIGRVIKFGSGVLVKTKDGEKNFKYKDLKSILLFAKGKNIFKNSLVIKDNEFFVVNEIKNNILECVNYLDETILFNKEDVKKFSGIIVTTNLLQIDEEIDGYELGRKFMEGQYAEYWD